MATIKSYTDLEQSKKLAKILPIESADFGWNVFVDGTTRTLPINDWDLVKDGSGNVKFYHAWSLAALLGVLPYSIEFSQLEFTKKSVAYRYKTTDVIKIGVLKDNLVDACCEMILKLNELDLL